MRPCHCGQLHAKPLRALIVTVNERCDLPEHTIQPRRPGQKQLSLTHRVESRFPPRFLPRPLLASDLINHLALLGAGQGMVPGTVVGADVTGPQ